MNEAESRVLVEQASQGDDAAVGELLEQHLPGLRAFVRLRAGHLLRRQEESQDLVQSVCREVLQHIDRYQYRSERLFKHWLYTTALRKLSNKRAYYQAKRRDVDRQRAPHNASGDGDLLDVYGTFITPSRDAGARETLAQIEAAFDELPEDYREVIVLSRIVGLSQAEVAAQMNRSERSVANLLYRAMARLSGRLVDG